MTKPNDVLFWASGCAILLLMAACGAADLIHNPLLERWCGQHPCDWEAEGTVKRVGSWHPNDYAVQLVSDDARLSQLNATVDYRESDCFAFTLIAKIDDGVAVFLELDFLDDGTVEFSQRLPASDWDRLTFNITAPTWYRGLRFIIRKAGSGRAIVAELSATNHDGQCTAPPIALANRPDGANCSGDAECADGTCHNGVCGGCADDAGCGGGTLCGRVAVAGAITRACVAEASAKFGELCEVDRQCQVGFCRSNVCSECQGQRCDDGRMCGPALPTASTSYWPGICAAGSGDRHSGELCTDNRDCASGRCDGLEQRCPLLCAPSDATCVLGCMPQIVGGQCK